MNWNDLNINSLKYFSDTIELNSVTLAAKRNYVSRPAISQAIKRLELTLGYNLINHKKNCLQLTNKGVAFLEFTNNALSSFIKEYKSLEDSSFEITIATSASIAEFLLLPALKKMKKSLASKVKIKIGNSYRVQQIVQENEASFGLIISDNDLYNLKSLVVHKGAFVLQSKTGDFLAPLITTESRKEVTQLFNTLKKEKKEKLLGSHVEIESWSVCNKALLSLGGTSLTPDFVTNKKVKIVKHDNFKSGYEIIAIFKNKNKVNPAERMLLEVLTD